MLNDQPTTTALCCPALTPASLSSQPNLTGQVSYMAGDLAASGGGSEDASTKEAEALAREADAMKRREREAVGHLGGSVVPASGAGGGGTKRKGGELAAVERETQRLKQAVPAEAVAAAAAGAGAGAGASNPEEIDLDDIEEGEAPGPTTTEDGKEIHIEGDSAFKVAPKAIPAAVFARAGFNGGGEEEEDEGESAAGGGGGGRVGALERLKGKK